MRYLFFISVIILAALLSATTQSQTVDVDNALVFYFDEGATSRSWYGTGEVTVFLIAGPMIGFDSQPYGFINSWGTNGMEIHPFGNVSSATLTARGSASPASFEITDGTFSNGFQLIEPLPLAGRTVLAELTLNVISSEPTYLTPCYSNGGSCDVDGVHRWFEVLFNDDQEMVLATTTINGPAPVAVEPSSWGQVKALYR